MAREYQLEVPSKAETGLTGFVARATKTIRGHVVTVEFWQHGTIVYRDRKRVEWLAASADARKFAHQVAAFLNSAQQVAS